MATTTRDIVHTKGTKHGQALSVESVSSSPSRLASGVRLRHTGQPPESVPVRAGDFERQRTIKGLLESHGGRSSSFRVGYFSSGSGPRPSALSPGASGKRFLLLHSLQALAPPSSGARDLSVSRPLGENLKSRLPNLLGLETAFLTVGRELKGSTLPHPSLASGWLRVKELRQSHL